MNNLLEKYNAFLQAKTITAPTLGFEVSVDELNPVLFPHQKDVCKWAIGGGCRAIFASFGLGKTVMQIQIIKTITDILDAKGGHTDSAGLIICPLGVKAEFIRDAKDFFGLDFVYVRTNEELKKWPGQKYFVTNYERVRDGQLEPALFDVVSLDEASVLRDKGTKTFQEFGRLFTQVDYKFVCTATPAPNEFKEIINYAEFLGVMDTGQSLTRFFKRNSQKAGELTIHPHKEREFWLWVSTWATFITKPSDLGYSDEGYDLPALPFRGDAAQYNGDYSQGGIFLHRIPIDHSDAGVDKKNGMGKLFLENRGGIIDNSKVNRRTLLDRCATAAELVNDDPGGHWLIWHYLEDERRELERMIPSAVSVYGTQDLDERESAIAAFSEGRIDRLSTKPELAGSGCNFQRYCHKAVYVNVTDKFNDFIQSIHRLQRFLQKEKVQIHLVYSAGSDKTYDDMMLKWSQHYEIQEQMTNIIKQYGLTQNMKNEMQQRGMGVERIEIKGQNFTAIHNDSILECANLEENSVDMFLTSWPFSDQYEYSPNYADMGHNDGDEEFFAQMDFLTPSTYRALKPGRRYCLHVKDRIVFGYQKPYGGGEPIGRYSVNPFSDKCTAHMVKHGFVYDGRITIDTDVVRENNQTNRLTRGEMQKDGTKMGVGMPEYILLFYKPQSDKSKGYADDPVRSEHDNDIWQLLASGIWRSGGDRFITPEKIKSMGLDALRGLWKTHAKRHRYDFNEHVAVNRTLLDANKLPGSFMLLQPWCQHTDWVWEDITRMKTLNTNQSQGKGENHTCPLQFDVVDRLILRYTQPGELVADPFGGLMTVPYRAMHHKRRGWACELAPDYFTDGVYYLRKKEHDLSMPTLFDLEAVEEMEVVDSL